MPNNNPDSLNIENLRKKFYIDGIHYSIFMIRLSYNKLKSDLLCLSKDDYMRRTENRQNLSKQEDFLCKISALSNIWLLIDQINRFRELLQQTPGLKQNSPELKLFYTKTEIVNYFRNNLQHLNQQIIQYVNKNIPVWNTINWTAKLDESGKILVFTLVPGSLFSRETPLINPFGKKIHIPIGLITLSSDKEVCLSELVENNFNLIVNWLKRILNVDLEQIPQSMFASVEATPNQ